MIERHNGRKTADQETAEKAADTRARFATGLGGLLSVMREEQPCDLSKRFGTFGMADTLRAMDAARAEGAEDSVTAIAQRTGQSEPEVARYLELTRRLGNWLLEKTGDPKTAESVQEPVDK